MSALKLAEKLGACSESIKWLKKNNIETVEEAWQKCPRGDWMLWVATRLRVNFRTLTLAKVECASTVKHLMKDERSLNALEVGRLFAEGKVSQKELFAAAAAADAAVAAYAAHAADAYAAAAAFAAHAAAAYAAHAAAADAADAYAAAAAADAAYAAHAAAAYAAAAAFAADTARKENQWQTAEICRKILTEAVFDAAEAR